MRESFGGVFIIKLLLIFIVFYMSFMAVAINYAKTFRVKNQVINLVEQNQYSGIFDDSVHTLIEKYLETVPYSVPGISCESRQLNNVTVNGINVKNKGICILPMSDDSNNQYYKVTAYIKIDFPFFGINLTVPVSGETKIIHVS